MSESAEVSIVACPQQTTEAQGQTVQVGLDRHQPDLSVQAGYEATNALLDQTIFILDEEAFAWFQAMLDSPAQPNDQLRALLLTKAPWE